MNKVILIILTIIAISETMAQEWKLQPSPTINALFDVFFIDKMKGWGGGEQWNHTANN